MRYIVVLTLLLPFLMACDSSLFSDGSGVGIRVVNETDIDFDTIRFAASVGALQESELRFIDVDGGVSTAYRQYEKLDYIYYESDGKELDIYLSNYFVGASGHVQYTGIGFGFCGTGLSTASVTEGNFSIVITGADPENKSLYIRQVREE